MISGSWNVGFTSGYISSGGDLGEAFKSGFFSAVGAAVSYGIGHGSWFSGSKEVVLAQQAFAHGISQGAIGELRGGSFKSGFIGGFLGKMTGGLGKSLFPTSSLGQYIAVTMIGGAVSEAAGGDFLEGAVAAAMVHLFNDGAGQEKIKKIFDRAVENYDDTMDALKVGPINLGNSASSATVVKVANAPYKNGLFYKGPYMSSAEWAKSGFKTTSMGLVDTAIFRVIEPIAIGTMAFSVGVAIGSVGVAIYEEF